MGTRVCRGWPLPQLCAGTERGRQVGLEGALMFAECLRDWSCLTSPSCAPFGEAGHFDLFFTRGLQFRGLVGSVCTPQADLKSRALRGGVIPLWPAVTGRGQCPLAS